MIQTGATWQTPSLSPSFNISSQLVSMVFTNQVRYLWDYSMLRTSPSVFGAFYFSLVSQSLGHNPFVSSVDARAHCA